MGASVEQQAVLQLKVQGADQYAAFRASLGQTRAELDKVGASASVVEAATATMVTSTDKASRSTLNLGYAGLTAGRALQDLTQGGIGGILNNIEGLTTSLGGSMGLAGLMTAVGVAAFIAKPYIASLMESLNPAPVATFKTELERLTEQVEKLKAAKDPDAFGREEIKLAEADLKRLTDAQNAFNEARGLKSKGEKESAAAVKAIIAEAGGEGVTQALQDSLLSRAMDDDDGLKSIRQEIAALPTALTGEGDAQRPLDADEVRAETIRLQGDAKKRIAKLTADAQAQAGRLLAGDPDKLADALEKPGRKDVADKIRAVTPAALKKKAEDIEQIKRDNENEAESIRQAQAEAEREEAAKQARIAAHKPQDAHVADMHKAEADAARATKDAAEKRKREAEAVGGHAAGQFGAGLLPEIQAAILGNKAQQRPASQEALDQRMIDNLVIFLRDSHATDGRGVRLDAEGRVAAARVMIGRAREDLAKREADIRERGQAGINDPIDGALAVDMARQQAAQARPRRGIGGKRRRPAPRPSPAPRGVVPVAPVAPAAGFKSVGIGPGGGPGVAASVGEATATMGQAVAALKMVVGTVGGLGKEAVALRGDVDWCKQTIIAMNQQLNNALRRGR